MSQDHARFTSTSLNSGGHNNSTSARGFQRPSIPLILPQIEPWSIISNTHTNTHTSSLRSESLDDSNDSVSLSIGARQPSYSKTHLLGIPGEVRALIWREIYNDIAERSREAWAVRPSNPYDGLALTCQQFYKETDPLWPQTIIQHHRISRFSLPRTFESHFHFRHLTLEIPFGAGWKLFADSAVILTYLAPYLQDLRIFFVGVDKFGVETRLHGCGKRNATVNSTAYKLTIDGQQHHERQPFFEALQDLGNLRSLTLSNCNYPLLQSLVLMGKPFLRQLHVESDPRSTLHREFNWSGLQSRGLLAPQDSDFPPVQDLYISANAALSSLHIASKCAETLRSLTWVVPDSSRQAGPPLMDWFENTAVLLRNLRMTKSSRLRKLRMCLEAGIYEGHPAYGRLISGFRTHLPNVKGLEVVEIHLRSKSPWLGREIVEALPNSVQRFYTSAEMISWEALQETILVQYKTDDRNRLPCRVHPLEPNFGMGRPDHPGGHLTVGGAVGDFECRRCTTPVLFRGKLGFVGYEWPEEKPLGAPGHEWWLENGTLKERGQHALLKLNGKLLDRERNRHLKQRHEGRFIGPRTHVAPYKVGRPEWTPLRVKHDRTVSTNEAHGVHIHTQSTAGTLPLKSIYLQQWTKTQEQQMCQAKALGDALTVRCQSWLRTIDEHSDVDVPTTDDIEEAVSLLDGLQLSHDHTDLETQDEPSAVLEEEIAAQWKDFSPVKYPQVVGVGEKEHWMTD